MTREFTSTGQHVVWKYPLSGDLTELFFAPGSIVHVGVDPRGAHCAWVLISDPDGQPVTRRVLIRGTGDPLPEGTWAYLNTFTHGPYIFHAFVGWPA